MAGYLTEKERTSYQKELTQDQLAVINQFKKYKINSALQNQVNQTGSKWQLTEEKINEDYDMHHPLESPLICSCGKHVKYLYVCHATDTGKVQYFGSKHLKDEANIPPRIIKEINQMHHKIDIGLDTILEHYHRGDRFPKDLFANAIKGEVINEVFNKNQLEYLKEFQEQNLPIYSEDYDKLKDAYNHYLYIKEQEERQKRLEEESARDEVDNDVDISIRLFDPKIDLDRLNSLNNQAYVNPIYNDGDDEGQNITSSYDFDFFENDGEVDSSYLQTLKEVYQRVFKYEFKEAAACGLKWRNVVQQLAVYCIYNKGDFERFDQINNLQEAIDIGLEEIENEPYLKDYLIKVSHRENIVGYFKDQLMKEYKALYLDLNLIGKDAEGHPVALNNVRFIPEPNELNERNITIHNNR